MYSVSAVSYNPPFYYSPRPRLVDDIPDHWLTLASPIIAYWSLSLFFHFLDTSGWKWIDKYRIHDSEEVKKRNLVSRSGVVIAVIFQQIIQTLMGYVWLDEEVTGNAAAEIVKGLQQWERLVKPVVEAFLGFVGGYAGLGLRPASKDVLVAEVTYFVYWWGVPSFQFFCAMYVVSSPVLTLLGDHCFAIY